MNQRKSKPLLSVFAAIMALCAIIGGVMGIRWLLGYGYVAPAPTPWIAEAPKPKLAPKGVPQLTIAKISSPIVSLEQSAKPLAGANIYSPASRGNSAHIGPEIGLAPNPAASDAMAVAIRPSLKYKPNHAAALGTATLVDPTAPKTQGLAHPARSDSNLQREKLIEAALQMEKDRQFTMSMCQDTQGCLWVGTEGGGVQRFDPSAPELKQWTQFTTKDGLGDDYVYAIACDHQGRIWVGHLNHGISVYNGDRWQNYEVVGGISSPTSISGPLGERIFNIKVCPTDGDIWMASNCGLARYSEKLNIWSYYTRAQGLPSDQAQAIAFDQQGDIYVGTQCDGVAISKAVDSYKEWRVTIGPEGDPTEPTGFGLPTNLINDMLVAHDGTVYVATTTGLAWSHDQGENWHYVRGRDYADKARGLYGGPPKGWKQKAGGLLAEDYCTCLAEDREGIWIGHRVVGSELISFDSSKIIDQATGEFARSILPGSPILCGAYGDGILLDGKALASSPLASSISNPGTVPLPAGAAPPTAEQLASLGDQLKCAPSDKPAVEYVGEDWTTQGDWVGRYGRQFAVLCAARSPLDHDIQGVFPFSATGELGPNHIKGDGIRRWVHWIRTDNNRCLYDPIPGYRRQAEWDDHGEAYPRQHEGPDIWVTLNVPAGTHCVSLYFMNKDGHDGASHYRDYLIEFKQYAPSLEEAGSAPTIARSRVRDFWGGVYPRFKVTGPAKFWLKIGKNNSLNTIVSAVFIDQLTGPPQPTDRGNLGWMGGVPFAPPDPDAPEPIDPHLLDQVINGTQLPTPAGPNSASRDILEQAHRLWCALDDAENRDGTCLPARQDRVFAYRAAQRNGARDPLLANWRWKLRIWEKSDREQFAETMARAHESLLKLNPQMVGQDY